MTIFAEPRPGEAPEAFQARREELIAHVCRKHGWPRDRAIALLEGLNHIGLAYVGVDLREERRADEPKYHPFDKLFTG